VGHVDRIALLATIKNGVKGFSTRISLKNAEDVVRPGMTANLSIPLVSADEVLAVPLAAAFADKGERFVYVKKGDAQFERQPVQLGVTDYDFADVTKGLKAGDVISLVTPPGSSSAAAAVPGGKSGTGGSAGSGAITSTNVKVSVIK